MLFLSSLSGEGQRSSEAAAQNELGSLLDGLGVLIITSNKQSKLIQFSISMKERN